MAQVSSIKWVHEVLQLRGSPVLEFFFFFPKIDIYILQMRSNINFYFHTKKSIFEVLI